MREMAGLAAVKVELDVEGLLAPPLPDDAPGRAGPSEMNVELKSEQHHAAQVKVEIKTADVKSESSERKRPGDRWATRAPVPPQGVGTAPAAKLAAVGRWGRGGRRSAGGRFRVGPWSNGRYRPTPS